MTTTPTNTIRATAVTGIVAFLLSGVPLSAGDGDILWRKPEVAENLEATPAIDGEGNVYVAAKGHIWSFSEEGELRWKQNPASKRNAIYGEFSSPALSPDRSVVFVACYEGVFALRADDGALIWKKSVPGDFPVEFSSTPAISADGSRLYVGAGDERHPSDDFFCLDARDGRVAWKYTLELPPMEKLRGFLGGAVVGGDGTVYVASQHGYLIALKDEGEACTEKWVYKMGAEMRQPPVIDAKGYVYQASNTGMLEKIDPATGASAGGNWPLKVSKGEIFASPAIGPDGTFYLTSEDFKLHAVTPQGTLKWEHEFRSWGSDPVVRDDGCVLFVINTTDQRKKGHVVCVRDAGNTAIVEWQTPIINTVHLNETNVNIAPSGTIYVSGGQEGTLYALQGNGKGLNSESPWPKYMKDMGNTGRAQAPPRTGSQP